MTVDDCDGGELIIAACEGSVFLRNCKNMTVHVACKQLRTRDCENVELHIFTTTDPVVEMSHHMTFRPFHLRLPGLQQSFKAARLDPRLNRFVHVYDFTADEPGLPKPHFTVLFPEHAVAMEDRYADKGALECPPEIEDLVALRLMPASSSESGQNKSYDIKKGAAVWAAAGAAEAAASDGDESVEDVQSSDSEPASSEERGAAPAVVPKVEKGADAAPAKDHKTTGGLDDEDYSSFDEDSADSHNSDDKYDVDEDDDDS
ncbi:hypothetical protein STCU_08639 [Strigomonas culicis]|uniref:C-CAP/cofactor C-like domain-containing protein n=1 Tax=Strigomonas culicis TaxID=28005 RepID=S9V2V6_9TRYP|nr:hypothetical protein STCU_08639 [Strigomonas culicis]|eukprot:EPY21241.1 hypothetical protein STCU_08639 [Strigomonas culicis]